MKNVFANLRLCLLIAIVIIIQNKILPKKQEDKKHLEMQNRMNLIKSLCSKYKESGSLDGLKFNLSWILVNQRHSWGYCVIPKSASSTLRSIFKVVNKYLDGQVDNIRFEDRSELNNLADLKNYVSSMKPFLFTFVRHPFKRLVSGFKDQILYNNNTDNKQHSVAEAVEKNFTKFVDHVLASEKCLKEDSDCDMNGHWQPHYSRCLYCQINYGAIGKVETWKKDLDYIFKFTNLDRLAQSIVLDLHRHKGKPFGKQSLDYFRELDYDRKMKLYEMYKKDFELFGYSPEMYL